MAPAGDGDSDSNNHYFLEAGGLLLGTFSIPLYGAFTKQ
jgi:hypothetical protein